MGRIRRKEISKNKKKINKIKSTEKTRKQLRKEKRQQKKISRAIYYQKNRSRNQSKETKSTRSVRRIDNVMTLREKEEERGEQNNERGETLIQLKKENQKVSNDTNERKRQKELKRQRMRQLKQENLFEDKMIKQLEKQLKLNKRKSKSIPKSFAADGLDYILDFCDSENRSHVVETEKQLLETGLSTEFEEDLNMAIGEDDSEDEHDEEENIDDNENSKQNLDDSEDSEQNIHDNEDSDQDMENGSVLSDKDLELDNNEDMSSEETNRINVKSKSYPKNIKDEIENENSSYSDDASEQSDDSKGLWEDIYGRQRDKKGNIISNKYVPPAARVANTDISVDSEKARRLEKQLKGILNRLAEQNMYTIANQVEEMYMSNSRNDMNVMLSKLMMEAIIAPILTPDRLISEHMMLIAVLHANVGTEVGAHFLLTTVKKFDQMLNKSHSVENKELDNIILMISHLYNFKVYGHCLLYQILGKLSVKFTEKEIELILLILRTVGFLLRKDDPLALKELILNLQQKANHVTQENSRIKFMLDVLLAIKNNNMNKIPQYDPTRVEHLRKILKSFIHKGNSVTQFNVTLEDLLEADERGKWWVVGSAWSGLKDIGKLEKTSENNQQKYSGKLLELARKQRMNTDIRRDIFCVLMTAEDYLDAFEKIHHLGLKNQQQREVIYVVFSCCIQEKKFNPYYAILAQKLCDSDRKYQLTIQYALWDKLKTLNDLTTKQLTNLAKFLTHLFLEKGLPLSVLKVIQFTELDKLTMRLVRQIMLGILLYENGEACLEVFERISQSPKLQTFRESLRLFINHFLVKNICATEKLQKQSVLLQKRVELVDKVLSTRESKVIF
ncbi:nucleolar MIF4G domain-containing protein 1 homolog [Odontomachus brunneus]|uniref:nucleolar MIF4G domain-containing protein 1 homolog n=1 Tax=Odontomachus brunneus TaxID=486640 RepID=UPI0013F26B40|nr:nucleolar MIF4G domain-containing protein 1 homolog [Odontomachus brunneus]XP_032676326.1 nucleolar MIF4G domain-containing protein 1 homolog [Odontomachus brunneus]